MLLFNTLGLKTCLRHDFVYLHTGSYTEIHVLDDALIHYIK